jgi:hypothetical protein
MFFDLRTWGEMEDTLYFNFTYLLDLLDIQIWVVLPEEIKFKWCTEGTRDVRLLSDVKFGY